MDIRETIDVTIVNGQGNPARTFPVQPGTKLTTVLEEIGGVRQGVTYTDSNGKVIDPYSYRFESQAGAKQFIGGSGKITGGWNIAMQGRRFYEKP